MFSKKFLLLFVMAGKIMVAPDTPRSIAESTSSRYSNVPAVDEAHFKMAIGSDQIQTQIEGLVRENTGHTENSLHTVPAMLKADEAPVHQVSPKKSPKRASVLTCCLKPGAQTESDNEATTPKAVTSAFKEAAESITQAAADSPAVVSAVKEAGTSIAKAAVGSAT